MDAAKVVTKLERIEYVEDPHLGKGSYCVVERHADGGACSVPDYAVIKIFRHIVQGEGPDTIVRGSTRPSRRCRRPVYGRLCVRPPVGAPSSLSPTASMRVLAAGPWRSGRRDRRSIDSAAPETARPPGLSNSLKRNG